MTTVAEALVADIKKNERCLQVISAQDLANEAAQRSGNKSFAKIAVSGAIGFADMGPVLKEFGLRTNQVVLKSWRGKTYLILKGYPGKREILRGTRYLPKNPQVMRLAIGPAGLKHGLAAGALKGSAITIVFSVGLEVFDFMIRDEASLPELFGTISSDLIKTGTSLIATAASGLAAGSFAIVAGSAAAPLVIAIAVGVATSIALDEIDGRTGATKALIDAYAEMGRDFREMEYEINRTINWLNANPCAIMQMFGHTGQCSGY